MLCTRHTIILFFFISLSLLTQYKMQANNFSEAEIEEMKLIMHYAPLDARLIINHLQDPTFFPNNGDYRSALFVGEPGSGKTIMAKAIAYHMALHGWEYTIIPSTFFLGEYRNQTAIKLQKELYDIEVAGKPTILIIDELNRLLENADSKYHDTDATSTALWTFLDKQEGNKNFFFIGTMNRIHKLPKPYKDRVFLDYIHFPLIIDPSITKDILRKYLTKEIICLDTSITDEFLHESLAKIGPCAGRDLKKISSMICRINKINNTENTSVMVIKKESITTAINEYLKRKEVIRYDLQEETEEERQERHHKENMQMQQEHFVQQQLIQVAINTYQASYSQTSRFWNDSTGSTTISEKGQKEIASIISDEQRELYEKKMKKTRQREANDARKQK